MGGENGVGSGEGEGPVLKNGMDGCWFVHGLCRWIKDMCRCEYMNSADTWL